MYAYRTYIPSLIYVYICIYPSRTIVIVIVIVPFSIPGNRTLCESRENCPGDRGHRADGGGGAGREGGRAEADRAARDVPRGPAQEGRGGWMVGDI
jgi:hypothetical protein